MFFFLKKKKETTYVKWTLAHFWKKATCIINIRNTQEVLQSEILAHF